ncbi:hypothetical protein A2436_00685 [candidate division WS6 bacterium RIFOXYC1_FULL_33_9]|uniref:TVP38/TMEM64 family membrane protein n=1 Tax=candidate division WS6 bacterium GW2011_GWB1_33_6 TaxID=1619088 RepID=A0A0G0CW43_9BACT|nr:MAG: Tvp38/tmem64 family inner membrane protein ydjz [candidate division WS6 bacterium GW2011_GWB1_33_6]OGC37198.1 MAG: hypothetical protein A2436_00685 [candidate division WS6 bacterium RIFOXYC1_FULL_33_9]HBB64993.1 hypothetical protein [Patescibacteria group bacterium]
MKVTPKRIIYTSISILLLAGLIYISTKYDSQEIAGLISKAGILAPILYILIQIAGQIFAPLSTSALFVAGFIMFGKLAILYAIITWLITSITNFYIARKYGKKVLRVLIAEEGITKIEDIASRIDTKRFFILRFSTFFINDFASYAFGLTNISFVKYYLATIVSMIPWIIIITVIMQSGDTILLTTIKIFLSMIPFTLISYLYLKRKK